METNFQSSASLTDRQLLEHVKMLATSEREATARLIASLAELDARRLYLGEGFPSMFSYCTEALHLSEHGAYNRIEVARAARRWPVILEMIADGAVTLTAVRLLGPSLTDDNHRQLLAEATHTSKRQVEQMVAALHPQPPVASIVRRLPTPNPVPPLGSVLHCTEPAILTKSAPETAEPQPAPAPLSLPQRRVAVIAPLAPERYKVQMTISQETRDKLRRVQDLMRHQVSDGDPAVVFDRALTLLLQDLERKKLADTRRPTAARHQRLGRATSRPRSGARCGSGTGGSAHSQETNEDAPNAAFSSFTTSSRLRTAGSRQLRIWNFAAEPTTRMRRSSTSERCSCEKRHYLTRSGTSYADRRVVRLGECRGDSE